MSQDEQHAPQAIERETGRLRLLAWQERHIAPFAALNADPEVMRHLPSPLNEAHTRAGVEAWRAQFDQRGWSNWAVELKATGEFIGFTGLSIPRRALPFSPCVEVGWRLARRFWGHGYATEGALAALDLGFGALGLAEIVSFTPLGNLASRAVMRRIGMHDSGRDFDHPALPEGSPLRRHCLYTIARHQWAERHADAMARVPPIRALAASCGVLEPLVQAHAAELFAVLSDPAIYEFENEPPPSVLYLAERYRRLEHRASADGSQAWLNWVVRLPGGELAGSVQATVLASGAALVAYELGSRHWRRGIGSAAVSAMLHELFTRYAVHTAVAVLKARNFRSLGLLRHLGFTPADARQLQRWRDEPDEIVMVKPAPARTP